MNVSAAKTLFTVWAGTQFDASTTGTKKTTPDQIGIRLGPIAAFSYFRGFLAAFNDSDAAVTVDVKSGAATVYSLSLAPGQSLRNEVDLSTVSGAAVLTTELTVGTAGTGTGEISVNLEIEQPIIVSGC